MGLLSTAPGTRAARPDRASHHRKQGSLRSRDQRSGARADGTSIQGIISRGRVHRCDAGRVGDPARERIRVGHPAPFPVELPERLIHLYTYKDDVVFDPFLGPAPPGGCHAHRPALRRRSTPTLTYVRTGPASSEKVRRCGAPDMNGDDRSGSNGASSSLLIRLRARTPMKIFRLRAVREGRAAQGSRR